MAVAVRDLARIHDFNSERSRRWADDVERRLDERMVSLLRMPNIGRPVPGSVVKRLSVADIQYVIDYELTVDSVRILSVRLTREIR